MPTGDFDGAGRDDLLVGLPLTRNGNVRLYFGRAREHWPRWASGTSFTDVLMIGADPSETHDSSGPFEWGICQSLTSGDHDGDGYDDFLIGVGNKRFLMDQIIQWPGAAYFLRGRPRSQWEPFIDLTDGYDILFQGAEAEYSVGYRFDRAGYVTGMGDIDGNGRDELFIAAPFADGPNNAIPDCGEIYVIYDEEATPSESAHRTPFPRSAIENYPNPFARQTTFRINAPPGAEISLIVYDAHGREVARPLSPTRGTGDMNVVWDSRNNLGRELPTGIYFVKLRAGVETHAKKIVVVR
jgi:hypothetical protein